MATSTSATIKRITLCINEEEAQYLKEILLNYLGDGTEPQDHAHCRAQIWNAVEVQL